MEKRIRIVWTLTIITLVLMILGQLYWLYNQSIYEQSNIGKELFSKCESLLAQEDIIRGASVKVLKEGYQSEIDPNGATVFYSLVHFNINPDEDRQTTKVSICEVRKFGTEVDTLRKFNVEGLSTDAITPLIHRYQLSRKKTFQKEVMDSLIKANSLGEAVNFSFNKSTERSLNPRYTLHSGLSPYITITYPYDPLSYQEVSFELPIKMQPILESMLWQLIGSIFLVVLLVVCMLYQIKTIIFQKRIDGIRREFMKNMIYEMKQSVNDDKAKDDVKIIGDTKFYYSMNELNFGDKTVIVTSRQAEIIKILSDNMNEVVPRNEILEKVWGDDSYSNSMALNVQITYIRRAFSSDSSISIEAIMKKGYLLKVLKNSDK